MSFCCSDIVSFVILHTGDGLLDRRLLQCRKRNTWVALSWVEFQDRDRRVCPPNGIQARKDLLELSHYRSLARARGLPNGRRYPPFGGLRLLLIVRPSFGRFLAGVQSSYLGYGLPASMMLDLLAADALMSFDAGCGFDLR
jgi:hypothetical protein